jgi:hypothetical protein
MALTLTVGTNTYLSLADAETYMEGRYDPTGLWAAATSATKNQLLVTATRIIDSQFWRGTKSNSSQALEFPRGGDSTTDDEYDLVEAATVEQALYVLATNPDARRAAQAQGVRSVSLPGLSESYAAGGVWALAPEARRLLSRWLVVCASFR